MVQQPGLFDDPPCQAHSATSRAAAQSQKSQAAGDRQLLYTHLSRIPQGLTDEEMQRGLDMGGSTQRPRRVELVQRGLVRDSGRTRLTRSGRPAVVWIAVPQEEKEKKDVPS